MWGRQSLRASGAGRKLYSHRESAILCTFEATIAPGESREGAIPILCTFSQTPKFWVFFNGGARDEVERRSFGGVGRLRRARRSLGTLCFGLALLLLLVHHQFCYKRTQKDLPGEITRGNFLYVIYRGV